MNAQAAGRERAKVLAWTLWGIAAVLAGGACVVVVLTSTTMTYGPLWSDLLLWGGLLAFATVTGFSARLRDEIDLDALSDELRLVVQETMEPASVTLWLRVTDPGPRRLPT